MSFFEPFKVRNFRYQWPADLATSWAFEMETLVLGWYIYTETDSVLLLTIFGSLLFIGTLLSPLMGVVADRIGLRNLICIMRAIYAVLATAMAITIYLDALTPTIALIIAFIVGLVRPSDMGMRSALVAAIMPPRLLVGAMSIARTTMDSARIFGALAGAGLFATIGIGATYIVIAMFYWLGLLLSWCISKTERDSKDHDATQKPSPWRDLQQGFAYIWSAPHLQAGMWLAVLVNLTAFPLTIGLLPYVAKDIYGTGETGLGYLLASFSVGALMASLLLGMVGQKAQSARMMLIFSVAWHTLLWAFCFTNDQLSGMALLLLAGFAQSMSMVPLTIMLLRSSDAAFRGRVMGIRMLAIYTLPIGLVISGTMIEAMGFRQAMSVYMITGIALTVFIGLRWYRDLWPATAVGNAR
ncbi:MAG: MFS transporter [Pseudomonadota bacterium]